LDACCDAEGESIVGGDYGFVGLMLGQSLERVLYVWAIRHPASGYVQGINDLATPFFQVFLSAYIGMSYSSRFIDSSIKLGVLDSDPENFDPSVLPKDILNAIEADSFWCLSRLLDGIQDNYIFAQPGIVRSIKRMADLVSRIDGKSIGLDFPIDALLKLS